MRILLTYFYEKNLLTRANCKENAVRVELANIESDGASIWLREGAHKVSCWRAHLRRKGESFPS